MNCPKCNCSNHKPSAIFCHNCGEKLPKKLPINKGFWRTFFLSLITLGIYQFWLIYTLAKETNIVCKADGKHTRGIFGYLFLSLITLGVYTIVWAVKLIKRRRNFLINHYKDGGLKVSTYLLTVFLWSWLTLGIMSIVAFCKFLYQQNAVNKTFNEKYNII
jgi:hypothetical protein